MLEPNWICAEVRPAMSRQVMSVTFTNVNINKSRIEIRGNIDFDWILGLSISGMLLIKTINIGNASMSLKKINPRMIYFTRRIF